MQKCKDISKRALLLARKFAKDESGATAIEYGLIAALIGLAVIGGASAVGNGVSENMRCTGRVILGKRIGKHCQAAGF